MLFAFHLCGLTPNMILIISSKKEYEMMLERLKPEKVLIYGNKIDGIKGNVEYISVFSEKFHSSKG